MSDNTNPTSAQDTIGNADKRRAAAILLHHARGDRAGGQVILDEVADDARGASRAFSALLCAMLDQTLGFLVELRTPAAQEIIGAHLAKLAAAEDQAAGGVA